MSLHVYFCLSIKCLLEKEKENKYLVFWSQEDVKESFLKLIKYCHLLNWKKSFIIFHRFHS